MRDALVEVPAAVTSHRTARVALALVHPELARAVGPGVPELDIAIEYLPDAGLFSARIESARPDLIAFEPEMVEPAGDLIAFTRSLWPEAAVFVVAHPWSERAEDLRAAVDGLLYKPPRTAQWRDVVAKGLRLRPSPERGTPSR
jgi:hypothetical protein